jgi:hypothetical protein
MGDNWISIVIFFFFWIIFFFFYPRLMLSQIMWKLEKVATELETLSDHSKLFLTKEISKKPTKTMKDSIDRFFEFFMIQPIALDPYGSIKRLDHLIKGEKKRFEYFINQIAPAMDKEKKAAMQMGMAGGITVHTIAKIVRHYVELIRKEKSYQMAMIIQMQLPMVERLAKAMHKGTQTMANAEPIGDALGPLAVTHLMGNSKPRGIEEDIVMVRSKMNGRNMFLVKANGPGGRIGYPGKAVEKLVKNNNIAKIISIDAAAKLEGEKTGSVAEGVGVAMGGPGVERSYIEAIAVNKNMPLDSIIVKMSQEEAITPMRKAIKDAIPQVKESLERSLENTKKGDNIIVVGVGNSSGIGNGEAAIKKFEKWVDRHEKQLLQAAKKRRMRKGKKK